MNEMRILKFEKALINANNNFICIYEFSMNNPKDIYLINIIYFIECALESLDENELFNDWFEKKKKMVNLLSL